MDDPDWNSYRSYTFVSKVLALFQMESLWVIDRGARGRRRTVSGMFGGGTENVRNSRGRSYVLEATCSMLNESELERSNLNRNP